MFKIHKPHLPGSIHSGHFMVSRLDDDDENNEPGDDNSESERDNVEIDVSNPDSVVEAKNITYGSKSPGTKDELTSWNDLDRPAKHHHYLTYYTNGNQSSKNNDSDNSNNSISTSNSSSNNNNNNLNHLNRNVDGIRSQSPSSNNIKLSCNDLNNHTSTVPVTAVDMSQSGAQFLSSTLKSFDTLDEETKNVDLIPLKYSTSTGTHVNSTVVSATGKNLIVAKSKVNDINRSRRVAYGSRQINRSLSSSISSLPNKTSSDTQTQLIDHQQPSSQVMQVHHQSRSAKKRYLKQHQHQHAVTIDTSLTKLLECISLYYSSNLTSPKWKSFKGLKIRLKYKIRLNNFIWRAWFMQWVRGRRPPGCQFNEQAETEIHKKSETIVLEGKYWKRKEKAIVDEYKKWRIFHKQKSQMNYFRPSSYDWDSRVSNWASSTVTYGTEYDFSPDYDMNITSNHDDLPPMIEIDNYQSSLTLTAIDTRNRSQSQQVASLSIPQAASTTSNIAQQNMQHSHVQPQTSQQQNAVALSRVSSGISDLQDQKFLSLDQVQQQHQQQLQEQEQQEQQQRQQQQQHHHHHHHHHQQQQQHHHQQQQQQQQQQQIQSQHIQAIQVSSQQQQLQQQHYMPSLPHQQQQQHASLVQPQLNCNWDRYWTDSCGSTNIGPMSMPMQTHSIQQPQQQQQQQQRHFDQSIHVPRTCDLMSPVETPQTTGLPVTQHDHHSQFSAINFDMLNSNTVVASRLTSGVSTTASGPNTTNISVSNNHHQNVVDQSCQIEYTPFYGHQSQQQQQQQQQQHHHQQVAQQSLAQQVEPVQQQQAQAFIATATVPRRRMMHDGSQAVAWSEMGVAQSNPSSNAGSNAISIDLTSQQHQQLRPDMAYSPMSSDGTCAGETGSVNGSIMNGSSQLCRTEQRRVCHINAEQKRRCNIKNGFDTLRSILPSVNQSVNVKISKASMLQKAAAHISKLNEEKRSQQEEKAKLQDEINSLKFQCHDLQQRLPKSGACSASNQRGREMLMNYFETRTKEDWRMSLFSMLAIPLYKSFDDTVVTHNPQEACASMFKWIEKGCDIVDLRGLTMDVLSHLSTNSNFMQHPENLPAEAVEAARKLNNANK